MGTARNIPSRLLTYINARKVGKTSHQAMDAAGVRSESTRRKYEREWVRAHELETRSVSSPILDKDMLASRLSQALLDPTTPRHCLAPIAAQLANVRGYHAPKQVQVEDKTPVRPLAEILRAWAAEVAAAQRVTPASDKTHYVNLQPADNTAQAAQPQLCAPQSPTINDQEHVDTTMPVGERSLNVGHPSASGGQTGEDGGGSPQVGGDESALVHSLPATSFVKTPLPQPVDSNNVIQFPEVSPAEDGVSEAKSNVGPTSCETLPGAGEDNGTASGGGV